MLLSSTAGQGILMGAHSHYEFTCEACGAQVSTEMREGIRKCGILFRLDWQAEYEPKPAVTR
jgi:hypothetical protein